MRHSSLERKSLPWKGKDGPKSACRDLEDIDLPMEFDRLTLTWQPVDAEEEAQEQERQQTEAQEAVLEVVRQLGKASTKMVTDELGGNSGTIWRQLNTLWKRGQLQKEAIGKSFYYFLPNHNRKNEEANEQMEFLQSGNSVHSQQS